MRRTWTDISDKTGLRVATIQKYFQNVQISKNEDTEHKPKIDRAAFTKYSNPDYSKMYS